MPYNFKSGTFGDLWGGAGMARLAGWALAVLLGAASPGWAQSAAPSWDDLVVAAKREGSVVVIGPAHVEVRRVLPAAFKQRFGINVEYLGGPGGVAAGRLRTERAAGIYSADVGLAASQTLTSIFYPEKMLDPIRPLLVMPEVLDKSKWRRGDLWFPDPEQQYVLRLFNSVWRLFTINTDYVKPEDMTSARDLLLSPKFKGKIATHDPTVSGVGGNVATHFYDQLGEDFVRQLYIGQEPVISRDERQLTDWLLRGTYPIVLGTDEAQVSKMRAEGFPLREVYELPGLSPPVTSGNGMLVVFNRAPHPNAAKLFVNWLASKEGMEVYARLLNMSPTRNDIDETSFVPAENIPRPGVDYLDAFEWHYTVETKGKVRLFMKDLLGR